MWSDRQLTLTDYWLLCWWQKVMMMLPLWWSLDGEVSGEPGLHRAQELP